MLKKIIKSIKRRGVKDTIKIGIIKTIIDRKRNKTINLLKKLKTKYLIRQLCIGKNKFLFALNTEDEGLCKQLLHSDIREELSTNYLINHFIKKDDIVLDIGANIGYYAILESLILKKGFVYAIEPVSENYKNLKLNVDINNLKNIKLFNCGMGNKTEEKEIFVPKIKNWSSFDKHTVLVSNSDYHKEKVKVYNLNNFIKKEVIDKKITFIRMDVEGYEYEIICGNKDFFKKQKSLKLMFELHFNILKKEKTLKLLKTLKYYGFYIDKYIKDPLFTNIEIKKNNIGLFETEINSNILNKERIKNYSKIGEYNCSLDFLISTIEEISDKQMEDI